MSIVFALLYAMLIIAALSAIVRAWRRSKRRAKQLIAERLEIERLMRDVLPHSDQGHKPARAEPKNGVKGL